MRNVLTALLFVCCSVNAQEQPRGRTTDDLAIDCRDAINDGNVGSNSQWPYCFGYLRATADLSRSYSKVVHKSVMACIPDGASNGQLARVFLKYADDHPNELHYSEFIGVLRAYSLSFPCATDKASVEDKR